MSVCIFCHRHISRHESCDYGLGHEYPPGAKPVQKAKPDLQLCTRCGLHAKNPAGMQNGCVHLYPGTANGGEQ